MPKEENIFLKNLDKRVETLEGKVVAIDKKMDKLVIKFDERMDHFEESNRKNGILLEKLDTKFDLSLEGYSSLKELAEKLNDRVTVLEGHA